eukprot:8503617-Alexandrium_andersonii.AAC.1
MSPQGWCGASNGLHWLALSNNTGHRRQESEGIDWHDRQRRPGPGWSLHAIEACHHETALLLPRVDQVPISLGQSHSKPCPGLC